MARKGFLDKITPGEIRKAIKQVCLENRYDPFRELIELATGTIPTMIDGKQVDMPICDVDQKIAIAREIASYLAPKMKSLEVSGEIDNTLQIEVRMVGGEEKPIEIGSGLQSHETQKVLADAVINSAKRNKDILGDSIKDVAGEDEE